MAPRRAATGVAGCRRRARARRAALALFLAATAASPAHAGSPALSDLLRSLELRPYPGRTEAPPLNGRSADGRPVSTADLAGRVVVVNFWASWCLECRGEMPALERLHREFHPRGLTVLGINAREDVETVRRFAAAVGVSFPTLLDPGGTIRAAYGVVALPTTFVVARDGRAVGLAVGPRDWAGAAARSLVEALLREPPPGRPRP